MGDFNLTQCMALAHLQKEMLNFLCNAAQGRLETKFFFNGMYGLISSIDDLVRENGKYSVSYSPELKIKVRFENDMKSDAT